jgi:hypothetical protein
MTRINDGVEYRPPGRWWLCSLCEASGIGGRLNYQRHYMEAHYELELERRRP